MGFARISAAHRRSTAPRIRHPTARFGRGRPRVAPTARQRPGLASSLGRRDRPHAFDRSQQDSANQRFQWVDTPTAGGARDRAEGGTVVRLLRRLVLHACLVRVVHDHDREVVAGRCRCPSIGLARRIPAFTGHRYVVLGRTPLAPHGLVREQLRMRADGCHALTHHTPRYVLRSVRGDDARPDLMPCHMARKARGAGGRRQGQPCVTLGRVMRGLGASRVRIASSQCRRVRPRNRASATRGV